MKKTTMSVIALTLSVLLAAFCFTACGENNTKLSETVTEAATEKATDANVETSPDATETKGQGTGGSDQSGTSDIYAEISIEDAVSKAIAAIGKDDLFADYSEKGEYNSKEAWIITFTDGTGMSYTAYVSSDFCEYVARDISENQGIGGSDQSGTSDIYAEISIKDAVSKAIAAIGKDDLFADYSEKGEYNSKEAWIITFTDGTGMSYTAYVSSDFCEYVTRDVSEPAMV